VKRAIAVVAAVVMVLVSLAVRSAMDDDSTASNDGKPVTIACIPELADACRSLANVTVRIEDAATTAKALTGIDGWVTFDPWPTMAAQLAGHEIAKSTTAIASSNLVIAMVSERAQAITPTCGGTVTWKCLGDNTGRPWTDVGGKSDWGTVKVGLPPATSGAGAVVLASAATSYFGSTGFATNDFDDQFRVWKSKLLATAGSFSDFIRFFPAQFSAVGTVGALANPGARANEVVFIPSDGSTVVVVSDLTGRGGRVANDLKRILLQDGWSDPGPSGLPDPGVVLALTGLTG
jgi:hypothetical protein